MKEPLVSACIGTFNQERYIRECLESILAQTYPHLEIIVADNASTDQTMAILESFGTRVQIVKRTSNSGMCSTTRNLAVQQARGKYIAFLDADDAWEPTKIEKQVGFLEANPAIPLCHTYCGIMDAHSTRSGIRHEGRIPPTGPYFEALLEHCWITISSVMMHRSLYAECGPFSEILPYGRLGEDYEFFLKVARTHDIGFLPEVLARYRKAGTGISQSNWRNFPEAFPFMLAIWRRADIFLGVIPKTRVDDAVWRSAAAGAQFWRDRGYASRAAYFPAQYLLRQPFKKAAWGELGKSLYRIIRPLRRLSLGDE
ncbi:MAG TPA: glycosyltransferase family A protein [Kiritimatiellia bacterium]|jgi:glycosyltransferase involved in cell wall biosynthesis|nr:MAG: UDP-Glc:alpha-D-GlcNAc-diphosphoundecaprenol beta-1,3-glucosyltransferase WfgD [Verrucomicrobia bacterium ADurb.Bin018]HOE37764.1 glycosyltransferase family A protein [Kiritimatiellia bacterium]HOR74114.1 glycosyltransferase family A protein [Kiritimatiellia bacterium]HOU60080.1 glycosyltransferase family A protein [Kiritimatiellia bacterium]HPV47786.1 glycosyltransferase family A protein [Kiritimatiellia bacterium]